MRKLRETLGLSQAQLAQTLGWSYSSVQQYERGASIPPDRLAALKTFAVEQGCADIAAALAGENWEVKRVLQPGETLIGNRRAEPGRRHAKYHDMLDRVLDSGMQDAVEAVQQNLVVFDNYVRAKQPPAPRHKKNAG